jgi:hypothetical protein
MRPAGNRDPLKFNTTGCIILPSALFIALMIATAGVAIWPKLAAPGAAILCRGETVYQSYGASYRPGEYTVTREIHCESGTGKDATREEITFPAMGVSFLIYSVGIFLLLQFVARPLTARRLRRKMEALGMGAPQPSAWPGSPAPPAGLNDLLARVQQAVQRGGAEVRVRDLSADRSGPEAGGGGIAARLAQLKVLRDQGLITAEDYEAKKAEILSGL